MAARIGPGLIGSAPPEDRREGKKRQTGRRDRSAICAAIRIEPGVHGSEPPAEPAGRDGASDAHRGAPARERLSGKGRHSGRTDRRQLHDKRRPKFRPAQNIAW
ncbi:MAG: hypothetical protein AB7H90_02850 [Alphaproteobacteria bacterium]